MSLECDRIHALCAGLTRHRFPLDVDQIPLNGLYVLFQEGETGHDGDRIVRVGTHTGVDQLRNRLTEHFVNENKDRSIFRKNIGRAILNKAGDAFLEQWELDLTSRENREKHGCTIDPEKQKSVEEDVSRIIQDSFSFVAIKINDKSERMLVESRIISTVSSCGGCHASKGWLGKHSPKAKIRESGLWQEQGLYKAPFSRHELEKFAALFV